MTGGDSSCQGWAVDSEMSTSVAGDDHQWPPRASHCPPGCIVLKVTVREGPWEKKFLLPQQSHSQQRKSAGGESDRASPPNTESFPIPRDLPAQSQTPGTRDPCQKERTKGTVDHVAATHRGTALAPPPPNTDWHDNT